MVDTGGKEIKIGNIDNHNIAKYHIMPTLKQKESQNRSSNYYSSACRSHW